MKGKEKVMKVCKVCTYRWESRVESPRVCPRCKRADWKSDDWKPGRRVK